MSLRNLIFMPMGFKRLLLTFSLCLFFTFKLSFAQIQVGEDIVGLSYSESCGNAVSLSSNGKIIAVGSPGNSDNGDVSGMVRIFENKSGNWVQMGQTIYGEFPNELSGTNLSLSSDGTTLAISSHGLRQFIFNAGAVRVFKYIQNSWVQYGNTIYGENRGFLSGWSLELNDDGTIVAIGAPYSNYNGTSSGHVTVYKIESNVWRNMGERILGAQAFDQSGVSLSLSSDGNIIAIGSELNDAAGSASGHVRVFHYINNNWVPYGEEIKGNYPGDYFGTSVSLSSDGNILAVGARTATVNGESTGQTRVFRKTMNEWIQMGQSINGSHSESGNGGSVNLSDNGNFLVIDESFNQDVAFRAGLVKLYRFENDNWVQVGNNIYGKFSNDFNGWSTSLSSDGLTVAIGSPSRNSSSNSSENGYARVFKFKSSAENTTSFDVIVDNDGDELYLTFDNDTTFKELRLFEMSGKLVYESFDPRITTTNLSTGVYILQAVLNTGTKSKKIIIE
ncbi:T9SS type A sorting domain-containing protein [Nonlabens sp. SCSIO 43208]|uniref:T9SS type A sorting domain-containing protein n=1 Tax=Nonlabens sp. SCSIO 43208 TaxID=2793009 RepID=UPI003D6AC0EC